MDEQRNFNVGDLVRCVRADPADVPLGLREGGIYTVNDAGDAFDFDFTNLAPAVELAELRPVHPEGFIIWFEAEQFRLLSRPDPEVEREAAADFRSVRRAAKARHDLRQRIHNP